MSEEQTPLTQWMEKLEAWTKENSFVMYKDGAFLDVLPTNKLPEHAALIKELAELLDPEAQTKASPEQLAAAKVLYDCCDINIDDGALVSEAEHGYWVQAWVWVDDEGEDE